MINGAVKYIQGRLQLMREGYKVYRGGFSRGGGGRRIEDTGESTSIEKGQDIGISKLQQLKKRNRIRVEYRGA